MYWQCAICSDGKRGNNRTTRICDACKKEPENRGWRASPSDEFGVEDCDAVDVGDSVSVDSGPNRYETGAAIEVMKLYCLDVGGMRVIAEMAGVSLSWAYEVVAHWQDEYGHTIGELRALFVDQVQRAIRK